MPGIKDAGKPKGKSTAYTCFVQTCRDEHKKRNPSEPIVLADFSKKCGEKWKAMNAKEKKRFEDLAAKDKTRFDEEMSNYTPADGSGKRKRKMKKDPNAPKRALSAFFCFCNEERPRVKAKFPTYAIGDVAKELGKRWEACTNRAKFEALAAKEKERYTKEIAAYKKSGAGEDFKKGAAAGKPAAKKSKPAAQQPHEDDEDEDEEEEEEEEDEESD